MKKFKAWSGFFRAASAVLALAVFLAFAAGGAAFAAQGDIVGLADLATLETARPNTYTADINGSGDTFELQIVQLQEDASGNFVPVGFPTADDALRVTWSQNTPGMYNGEIDTYSYEAYPASVGGYYLSVFAANWAESLGPDSWRATDPSTGATGDFSFVATAYNAPDSGAVANIKIELYDGSPMLLSPFAAGSFGTVNGNDDYTSITGDHGRSYPTPLDSVAHCMVATPPVISI
ncbi:MAG: hypothetical protein LBU26_01865, partial [Synergistaceae bacterium]|nr:hypothetical protein [Synergistaceae bacterium]